MAGILAGRHQVTISGNEYDILPHPSTEGLTIVLKIGSYLDLDMTDSMKVISSICIKSLKEDPKLTFLMDLLKYTQLNGKTLNRELFDEHFAGNYKEMLQVITEVFKANRFLEAMNDIGDLIN